MVGVRRGGVDVVTHGVERRGGVGLGADASQGDRGLRLGAGGGGAAREQVLQEVRQPGAHVFLLVQRAGFDPDLDRHHRRGAQRLGDQDHAVGQTGHHAIAALVEHLVGGGHG